MYYKKQKKNCHLKSSRQILRRIAGGQSAIGSWGEGKLAGLSADLVLGYGNKETHAKRDDIEQLLDTFQV